MRRRGDGGFGLIELMVAMTIFGIAAAAATPLFISSLRAGLGAKLHTQGKALAQERLEVMRNLPYHVAHQNGDYVDVLDIYYRDLQASGALAADDVCSTRAYSSSTKEYVCTVTELGADYAKFTQQVSLRFLDRNRAPMSPLATYDSQVEGFDRPASNLLAVTIVTSWDLQGDDKQYTLRSEIANAAASETLVRTAFESRALQITSNLASGDVLQLEAGVVSANGGLTTGSTAALNATGAIGSLASGTELKGASISVVAPPAAAGGSPASGPQRLDSTCDYICFSGTSVTGDQNVSIDDGLAVISAEGNPVTAVLRRNGDAVFRGYTYNNAATAELDPSLGLIGPVVSAGSELSTAVVASTSGHIGPAGSGTGVTATTRTGLAALQMFPTSFAPQGVVQLVLDEAELSCTSGGGTASVTSDWSGTVRYWSASGYVSLPVGPGAAALPDPSTLEVLSGVSLSRWVQSWASATDTSVVDESLGSRAVGTLSSAISVLSQPTRALDSTSAVSVTVGKLACTSEDAR